MDQVTQCCWYCKIVKPVSAFGRDKSRKSGLNGACKDCCRANRRAYYAKHGDSIRKAQNDRLVQLKRDPVAYKEFRFKRKLQHAIGHI